MKVCSLCSFVPGFFLLNTVLVCLPILLHVVRDFLVPYSNTRICDNLLILSTLNGRLGILKWWLLRGYKGMLLSKHTFPHNPLYWLKFFIEIFSLAKHINCKLIYGLVAPYELLLFCLQLSSVANSFAASASHTELLLSFFPVYFIFDSFYC